MVRVIINVNAKNCKRRFRILRKKIKINNNDSEYVLNANCFLWKVDIMHYTFLVVEYLFEMCIIIIYFHSVEPIYIIISQLRLRLSGLLQVLYYW